MKKDLSEIIAHAAPNEVSDGGTHAAPVAASASMGVATGAAVGLIAGLPGVVAGALIGGVAGALAGELVINAVDPREDEDDNILPKH